jgi:hypothetical protein
MVARAPCAQPRATTRRYSLSLEGFLHTHTHTHTHTQIFAVAGRLPERLHGRSFPHFDVGLPVHPAAGGLCQDGADGCPQHGAKLQHVAAAVWRRV